MRKNFNKLATLALSGMMVMSMAVPAFAAPKEANEWTKVLFTDTATPAPNTTFKFNVTAQPATEVKVGDTKFTTIDGAKNDAVVFGDVKFNRESFGTLLYKNNDPNQELLGRQFKQTVAITVDTDKLVAGKYGYYLFQMQEEHGGYEGIQYSRALYDVLVYWEKGKDPKVFVQKQGKGNWLKNETTGETCKIDTIYNNYGMHEPPVNPDPNPDPHHPDPDPEPNDSTHDVYIKKKLDNKIGDTKNKFNFKIEVVPDHGKEEDFGYRTGAQKEKATDYKAFKGGTGEGKGVNVELTADKEDSGIQIGGLTVGDKIIVTETDGQQYTMTVTDNNTTDPEVTYIKDRTAVNSLSFSFNSVKDGGVVTVTNSKTGVTPTGIVMNVAPYAMMLAVAGGLGVVFVNRKKEEE